MTKEEFHQALEIALLRAINELCNFNEQKYGFRGCEWSPPRCPKCGGILSRTCMGKTQTCLKCGAELEIKPLDPHEL